MSVEAQVDARLFPWSYAQDNDARLPIVAWAGEVSAVGDASGSSLSLQLRLVSPGPSRSSQLFSVEGYDLRIGVDSSETVEMVASGFSLIPGVVDFTQRYTDSVIGGPTAQSRSQSARGLRPVKPWYLGVQTTPAVAGLLEAVFDNVDTVTFDMIAWGYMWGPSARAAGGPRRPPGSPWGD